MFNKLFLSFVSFVGILFFPGMTHAQESKSQQCSSAGCSACFSLYPDEFKYETAVKDGKLNGVQKINYLDGKTFQEISYKNGKVDGSVKIYYPDGTLWADQNFRAGLFLDESHKPKNGIYQRFYKNGQLARETKFKDGLPQGESKAYYEDGRLKVVETYTGQDAWLLKTYDKRGQIMTDGKFFGQKFIGTSKLYNEEGKLEWEYTYQQAPAPVVRHFDKNGKVNADFVYKSRDMKSADTRQYYESGKLKAKGKFDGKAWDGAYREFFENGKTKLKMTYKNGVPMGIRKDYNEDGTLATSYNYLDGYYRQEYAGYYKNGKLQLKMTYKNGVPIGVRKDYNEDGTLAASYNYLEGFTRWEYSIYNQNGKMKSTCMYTGQKDMKREGVGRVFYNNGTLFSEETYTNDVPTGVGKVYYEDGGVKKETSYIKGDNDFDSKEYYKSGKIRAERQIRDNKPRLVKVYYENGTLWSEMQMSPDGAMSATAYDEEGKVVTSKYDIALSELKQSREPYERFVILDTVAKEAFKAGRKVEARQWAEELRGMAPQYQWDWNYGNAIHSANIVLGRIAAAEGRMKDARNFLIAAGKSPGSVQMDTFGPNMSLAKDLLEKGEKDVVLHYFVLCGKFWTSGADQLKKWSEEVKAGNIPDFGANLVY